jgi:hypothetical protein
MIRLLPRPTRLSSSWRRRVERSTSTGPYVLCVWELVMVKDFETFPGLGECSRVEPATGSAEVSTYLYLQFE